MKTKFSFTTIQFSNESLADLRGKQSVRTTFKLSERSINALSILACQMGIKQKSLFDHLVDDMSALKVIAKEAEGFDRNEPRVVKTYVVSRRTLENLEKVSERYNTPRDALVEFSIGRIIPLIAQEKEKYMRQKTFHKQMATVLEKGKDIVHEADEKFDLDDPVFAKYMQAMRSLNTCFNDVEKYLEKGQRVEDF